MRRTKHEYFVHGTQFSGFVFDRVMMFSYVGGMAKLDIIKIPDARLREVSKPVERIDEALLKFLDDMAETMYEAPGIGLAAIQVAEPLRVLVVDCDQRSKSEEERIEAAGEEDRAVSEASRNPIFMINPEIVAFSDIPSTYEEGCLSIPDYFAEVERPQSCHIRYVDRSGQQQLLEADGLLSTCVQHEVDHLNGKLFIDLMSKLKREMVIRKFTKLAKQSGSLPDKRMIG